MGQTAMAANGIYPIDVATYTYQGFTVDQLKETFAPGQKSRGLERAYRYVCRRRGCAKCRSWHPVLHRHHTAGGLQSRAW